MHFDPIFLLYIPVFLFSLTVHEFAHAWMARHGGDMTATYMGRLTLNPIAHIDPVGTILLPLIALVTHFPMFGWAKPVPVNQMRLRKAGWMVLVALGGPASNLMLAFLVALAMRAGIIFGGAGAILNFVSALQGQVGSLGEVLFLLGQMFIQVNFALAIFNMIPIPPLDGSSLVYHYFVRGNLARERVWWQLTQTGLGFLLIYFLFGYFPPMRALLSFAFTRPIGAVFQWVIGGVGGLT